MEISEKIKNQILDIIFKYVDKNLCSVFIFGSYARSEAKQYSDIDIGLICKKQISLSKVFDIKSDLNENVDTLRDIDVVNFNNETDKEFLEIALKDIKIWHETKESKDNLDILIKHSQR